MLTHAGKLRIWSTHSKAVLQTPIVGKTAVYLSDAWEKHTVASALFWQEPICNCLPDSHNVLNSIPVLT